MTQHNLEREISWRSFNSSFHKLISQMDDSGLFVNPPSKILYIARGGMIPACMLAHALNIKNVQQLSFDVIERDFFKDNVLIVDDILDTGHTLTKLFHNALNNHTTWDSELEKWNLEPYFKMFQCHFAFPYVRQRPQMSSSIPNPYQNVVHSVRKFISDQCFRGRLERTNDWLVFPWENTKHYPDVTEAPNNRIIGEVELDRL